MIEIRHNSVKDENGVIYVTVSYSIECDFDYVRIFGNKEILACDSGEINENIVTSKEMNNHVYFDSENDISVSFEIIKGSNVVFNTEYKIEMESQDYNQGGVPIIFTGKNKKETLYKKLDQRLCDTKFSLIINKSKDLFIQADKKPKEHLFAIGENEKELSAKDIPICMVGSEITIPKELLEIFINKMIALHLLVKADYQKSLSIYYKSPVSRYIKYA